MKYLRVFLFGVLVISLTATGVVVANKPDEPMKPTSITISKPKEEVKPVENEPVVEPVAPVVETPKPVAVSEPTVKVLFNADSTKTYPANPSGRLGIVLPTFTPTGQWAYSYNYSCNGPGVFTIQIMGMNDLVAPGLRGFSVIKRQDSQSDDRSVTIISNGFPMYVSVTNTAGCTWHISATQTT